VEERLRKALRESGGRTGIVIFPADAEFILAALSARDSAAEARVLAARRAGREEAAKVADAEGSAVVSGRFNGGAIPMAERIATRIRALPDPVEAEAEPAEEY